VLIDARAAASAAIGEVRHGRRGGRPDVRLLGGYFAFESPDAALLVSLLPAVVHVRGLERLSALVKLVGEEAGERRPGREPVLARLVELLLIEALRSKPADNAPPGLLRGIADTRMAAAMRHIHGDPARSWTVAWGSRPAATHTLLAPWICRRGDAHPEFEDAILRIFRAPDADPNASVCRPVVVDDGGVRRGLLIAAEHCHQLAEELLAHCVGHAEGDRAHFVVPAEVVLNPHPASFDAEQRLIIVENVAAMPRRCRKVLVPAGAEPDQVIELRSERNAAHSCRELIVDVTREGGCR
jgi:hypothetical protein